MGWHSTWQDTSFHWGYQNWADAWGCSALSQQWRGLLSNHKGESFILQPTLIFLCLYNNSYGLNAFLFFIQDLAATDHTYSLLDPCTTKARLFNVLDANSWLQKRLQTKCRLIKRMKLKLQDAQRELLTLRRQLRYRYTHRQRYSQLSMGKLLRDLVKQ